MNGWRTLQENYRSFKKESMEYISKLIKKKTERSHRVTSWTWKHKDLDQICPKISLDTCYTARGLHMNQLKFETSEEPPNILEESIEECSPNEMKAKPEDYVNHVNRLDLESRGSWPTMPPKTSRALTCWYYDLLFEVLHRFPNCFSIRIKDFHLVHTWFGKTPPAFLWVI